LIGPQYQSKLAEFILQKVISQSICKIEKTAKLMNLRQAFHIIKAFSRGNLRTEKSMGKRERSRSA
jgi:DNA-binding XRE family transcriptional regulator